MPNWSVGPWTGVSGLAAGGSLDARSWPSPTSPASPAKKQLRKAGAAVLFANRTASLLGHDAD